MDGPELSRRAALALSGPLLEFLAIEPVDEGDPTRGIAMAAGPNALTALGAPQAGALATALELAAYLALLPELSEEEDAVTHQFSAGFLARAEGDAALIANGEVLRRTRRLAFVSARLHQANRLLASAQVTKSIVSG